MEGIDGHCTMKVECLGVVTGCPGFRRLPLCLEECSAPCTDSCSYGSWSPSSSSAWSCSSTSEAAADASGIDACADWQGSHPEFAQPVLEGNGVSAPQKSPLADEEACGWWPEPYPGVMEVLPLGIKVDASHDQLLEVGAALVQALQSGVQQMAGTDPAGSHQLYLVQAACFPGCVQLLAGMYLLRPRPGPAAGSSSSSEAGDTQGQAHAGPGGGNSRTGTPLEVRTGPHTSQGSWCNNLAANLLAKAAAALQAAAVGSATEVAAAVEVGSGASAAAAATRVEAGPDAGSAGAEGVSFIALDPPVAPAGRCGPVELFVRASTTAAAAAAAAAAARAGGAGHSASLRLLVFDHTGVVVEQEVTPCEVQSCSIRVCLPALPVGVYHVALLPPAAANPTVGLGSAGHLLLQPLLVLPAPAAAELHQHWRACLSHTAATVDSWAQAGGGCGVDGEAHLLLIMQTAWVRYMQGLITDMACVMLAIAVSRGPAAATAASPAAAAAAAAAAPRSASTTMGVVRGSGSSSSSRGSMDSGLSSAGMQGVLGSLLFHFSMHLLGNTIQVMADIIREGCPGTTLAGAGPIPGLQDVLQGPVTSTDGSSPRNRSSSDGRAGRCSSCDGTGEQGGTKEDPQACLASTAQQASTTVDHSTACQPQGQLASVRTGWCMLLWGHPSPAAEADYMAHQQISQTGYPDVMGAIFFLVFVGSIGVLTDPYLAQRGSLVAVGWEKGVRLIFCALYVVPALLIVVCRSQLQGARREGAQLAMGACLVIAAWLVPLGLMPMTPSLARTLVNSWKSWCVVLLGMGVFNAVCRQMRARRLALPLLLEFMGWWAAAVWVEGHAAGPAALRFGCGYAAGMLTSAILELRSRERLAAMLVGEASAGRAVEVTGCTPGERGAASKSQGLVTSTVLKDAAGMSSVHTKPHAD